MNIKFIVGILLLTAAIVAILAPLFIAKGLAVLIPIGISLAITAMAYYGIKWVVEEWPL